MLVAGTKAGAEEWTKKGQKYESGLTGQKQDRH